jgi:hypothetical protein
MTLARLQNRLLLNQLAHPVDEETHLGREMTAFRVHDQDGVLLRCPVSKHLRELPRFQVRTRDVVRDLHDSKAHQTGDEISVVVVDRQYAVEGELDFSPVLRELPIEDSSGAI